LSSVVSKSKKPEPSGLGYRKQLSVERKARRKAKIMAKAEVNALVYSSRSK